MAAHRYTLLDVFTSAPLAGNALAVVHDADGIDEATMHRVARETKLSETSFLQAPTVGAADYRHRIWMLSGEIPFAGHPSLGAAVAVARARGERAVTYVQQTGAGLQPVQVALGDDGLRAHVSMLQEPAVFGPEPAPEEVVAALGLRLVDADPDHPPQVVSTGAAQVLAFVADASALGRITPDHDRIGALLAAHGALTLYVAHVEGSTASARSFCQTAEMGEDPATGSAAGPLCACVAARGGASALDIAQGVAMGRPSALRAAVEGDRVRVGGEVVVLVDGTIHLEG